MLHPSTAVRMGGGKRPRSELRYLGCKVEGVTTLPGLGVQDSRQARGQGGEESVGLIRGLVCRDVG